MSRLVFQEEILSEDERSYDSEEEPVIERNSTSFQENNTGIQRKIKENNPNGKDGGQHSESDTDEEGGDIDNNKDDENESESDHSIHDDSDEYHGHDSPSKRSSPIIDLNQYSVFLSKFLQTKKSPQVLPPPPTIPLNDYILKEFAQSEKQRHHKRHHIDHEVEKEEDESVHSFPSTSSTDHQMMENISGNIENESSLSTFVITLFNLPYNMPADEIEIITMKYGVQDVTAKLNYDKKTNRPAGSAQLFLQPRHSSNPDFDPSSYLQAIIKLLDGQNYGGREVRARSSESKGRPSVGGRYFGGDISVKCNNCGQVGHRQSECPQEPVPPPCHFCAGTDHEPQDCSNIACFRCSNFGHHSRNCPNSRASRPVICTLCGSFTHDKRFCHMPPIDAREKLESPRDSVICMCCGKYGHVMCLTLPMPKNRAMYCPDCGFSGHNVEYVRYPDEEPSCRNPKLQRYRRRSDESASSTSNYGRDNEKRKGYFDDDDMSNKPPTQRRNITFPSHFDQNHSTSENSRRNADNNRTVRRAGSAFSRGGSSSGGYKGRIIHR